MNLITQGKENVWRIECSSERLKQSPVGRVTDKTSLEGRGGKEKLACCAKKCRLYPGEERVLYLYFRNSTVAISWRMD